MSRGSRRLLAALLLLPALLRHGGVLPCSTAAEASGGGPVQSGPVQVYAELDGSWSGSFVGYDAEGRELYRIRVRQTYTTVDPNTQRVEIADTLADGTVVTGRGVNTAHRRPDGGLELSCVVEKSDGDRVEHRGRLIRGPDGEEELVWHSSTPGRTETFRERVRHEAGATWYLIDGLGRYGDTLILMAGRYRKE